MNQTILLIDDDLADQGLVRRALRLASPDTVLHTVGDGQEALEYLLQKGKYESTSGVELPALILLDINMPRIDGRGFLRAMRHLEMLRHIPVVTFTTSTASKDIQDMYLLGTNSFISKPSSFKSLVDLMEALHKFWFETASLPA